MASSPAPTPTPPDDACAADETVPALAAEILHYLRAHPLQADTDAHIARWWLLQCRVERALGQVRAALHYLEAAGEIERGPSGVYRLPAAGRTGTEGCQR